MSRVNAASPRPRQVTVAAWLIMLGSAAVVVLVFDRLTGLHSLETRESVQKFLAEPPGSDLDVGVDWVLDVLRTVSMVAAGCATAAAILGYHVLRRSRSARLVLTVLALPLFLTGVVTGGFISSVVAASAAMLWLQPARDWFRDGSSAVGTSGARPGARRQPQPLQQPQLQQPQAAYGVPPRRPSAVVRACVLTWLCAALGAVVMVVGAVALAVEPDRLLDEVHRQNPELAAQGVSDGMLLGVAYALVAGLVLWCLAAAVLAALVFRRLEWARIALVVSAAAAAVLCLLGTLLGAFVLVLPLAGSAAALALLVRPEVRAWSGQRG